ncbi:hypothetical protein AXG93_3756s1200 [Marchantia polymorpha subsp. ruderalis]|uniref:Uncharacterized protein n=1 Tax=Marchantia polymorpha subsp. ruderalis TaxID=1480154 RepID=A0A176VFD3_MARPO|nr:hypothetical protein AXG93_3756s1200 [Marchantia polymorpha subsp. ruderalis]
MGGTSARKARNGGKCSTGMARNKGRRFGRKVAEWKQNSETRSGAPRREGDRGAKVGREIWVVWDRRRAEEGGGSAREERLLWKTLRDAHASVTETARGGKVGGRVGVVLRVDEGFVQGLGLLELSHAGRVVRVHLTNSIVLRGN